MPIGSIHAAHQLDASVADAAFAALRHLPGKTVMVVRQGFRATVLVLDDACWTRQLLAGVALGPALEHVGEGFDFGAWLARAVREAWLERIDHVQASSDSTDRFLAAGQGPLPRPARTAMRSLCRVLSERGPDARQRR